MSANPNKKPGLDIATSLGLVMAAVAILGGQALEGGSIGSLIQPTAAIIVLGGTFRRLFCAVSSKRRTLKLQIAL